MGAFSSCVQRPPQGRGGDLDVESEEASSSAPSSRSSSKASSGSEISDERIEEVATVSMLDRIRACVRGGNNGPFTRSETLKVRSLPPSGARQKALLVDNTGKVLDDYFEVNRSKVIGEGGYASVVLGKERRTGAPRAIKCITKKLVADKERLQREIEIVMGLDHPNINRLYQSFEDSRNIYLVLELCNGGELFDRIQELGYLSEREAAIIMQQIFRAVNYMHGQCVCHRDLKPENFLFQHKKPIEGNTLKVIDFGIAATFEKGRDVLCTRTGTPYYVAPEVLGPFAQYGCQVDMWSCGVVMYVLLSGRLPFRGANDPATFAKVKSGKFSFPGEIFGTVSEGAKSLIKGLLTVDVEKRLSADLALNDTWTKEQAPTATPAPLKPQVVQALRLFQAENKLKKVALHVVARQLDEAQIKHLKNVFMELDADGDGNLTLVELSQGLKRAELGHIFDGHGDLIAVLKEMDTDGSGSIDYTEFLAATLERRQYNNESMLWAAFRVFDKNDDGQISKQELKEVMASQEVQQVCSEGSLQGVRSNIEELMAEVDKNGDGFIDFEEFCAMMLGSQG